MSSKKQGGLAFVGLLTKRDALREKVIGKYISSGVVHSWKDHVRACVLVTRMRPHAVSSPEFTCIPSWLLSGGTGRMIQSIIFCDS